MQSVYALGDPRTNEIRYIGIAKDVYKRYAQHLNHPHQNEMKNAWMAEIKKSGIVPTLTLLEVDVDENSIRERERYWIQYYLRRGASLTNIIHATTQVSEQVIIREIITPNIVDKTLDRRYNYDNVELFRHKNEARWAVFFDALEIKWFYEFQQFYRNGEWYSPSFWLPDHQYWIEIKGQFPTKEERDKIFSLDGCFENTNVRAFLFYGFIGNPDDLPNSDGLILGDSGMRWCECPYCGDLDIQWSGMADRLDCGCIKKHHGSEYRWTNSDSPRLMAAYTAARQARFEHLDTLRAQ